MDWNLASRVVSRKNHQDPFRADSLASYMCNEIRSKLMTLAEADRTVLYFGELVKGRRKERLKRVCLDELAIMDERFESGQVKQAAMRLSIFKSKL